MMRRILSYAGTLALICASCAPCYRDTTLYQRSGRQKAIVAVLPVIDQTDCEALSWDLSTEFTDEIRKRVYDSHTTYLLRDHGSQEIAEQLNTPNPTKISLPAAKSLGAAEFVVVTELIDQKERPVKEGAGSILNLSLRVRVLDVRHEQPKVVLQEVLNHEHVIARPFVEIDYERACWGTEAFLHTPLGMAHNKMVRELVSRVETYIEATR